MGVKAFDLSLYLVLDPDLCRAHSMVETARLAAANGATMVQLRDKGASTAEMIETGRALQAVLSGSGVALIVNDDVEAALAIGADGVHVGQGDMAVSEARRLIGTEMILGLSVETEEAARRIDPALVDYAGISPIFATATKPDHQPPIGFEGLTRIVAASPVPSVAIGGLKRAHVAAVFAAGADGMAVVSAICGQDDPGAATRGLAEAIKEWRAEIS